jgi:hypothetical protein
MRNEEKSERNEARGWEAERSGRSIGGMRKSMRGMEQEDGMKRGVGGQKGGMRKSLRGMEQEDGTKRGVGGQKVE